MRYESDYSLYKKMNVKRNPLLQKVIIALSYQIINL